MWDDEVFDFQNFTQVPPLVLMETCYAFDMEEGGGLCSAVTALGASSYLSGITPLSMYGATETYWCYMEKMLSFEDPLQANVAVMNQCARENSPFVLGSHSGVYLITSVWDIEPTEATFDVQTTDENFTFTADGGGQGSGAYLRFHLYSAVVTSVLARYADQVVMCEQEADELPQLKGESLRAGEFKLSIMNDTCWIANVASGDTDIDVFGVYPDQNCTNLSLNG